MDIALVGAPESGKTKLANALAKELDGYSIIDGYAQEIARELDIVLGPYATYVGNFIVAGERLKLEVECMKREQPYIVCGTLVETITYQALSGSRRPKPDEARRTQMFLGTLGSLLGDMHAAVTFFLPGGDERISAEMVSALDILQVPYARLPEDPNERCDQALAVIESARTALEQAPEVDERGVRPGDGDGSEEWDPSQPMPDLPQPS